MLAKTVVSQLRRGRFTAAACEVAPTSPPCFFTSSVRGQYMFITAWSWPRNSSGAFAVQYVKKAAVDIDIPSFAVFAAIPLAAVLFVGAGELGILNQVSGVLAKGLLDGWNLFAVPVLPGAILKY